MPLSRRPLALLLGTALAATVLTGCQGGTPAAGGASPTASGIATSASPRPTTDGPRVFLERPADYPGMRYGTLTAVDLSDGQAVVTIRAQRFLVGKEAADYYAAHPDLEPLDHAVVDESGATLQFRLTPSAVIWAQWALGDHDHLRTQRLTPRQLDARFAAHLAAHPDERIGVWLHPVGGSGAAAGVADASPRVDYLAEQYLP